MDFEVRATAIRGTTNLNFTRSLSCRLSRNAAAAAAKERLARVIIIVSVMIEIVLSFSIAMHYYWQRSRASYILNPTGGFCSSSRTHVWDEQPDSRLTVKPLSGVVVVVWGSMMLLFASEPLQQSAIVDGVYSSWAVWAILEQILQWPPSKKKKKRRRMRGRLFGQVVLFVVSVRQTSGR